MKLRIQGNSVRLRLQRSEIAQLKTTGRITEILELGPSTANNFAYSLTTHPGETVQLRQNDGAFTVEMPISWAATLALTEQVGYDEIVPTMPGVEIRVIIEKDFQCLVDRPGEDDADSYPNPKSGKSTPHI